MNGLTLFCTVGHSLLLLLVSFAGQTFNNFVYPLDVSSSTIIIFFPNEKRMTLLKHHFVSMTKLATTTTLYLTSDEGEHKGQLV